jgi:hypothetical protein
MEEKFSNLRKSLSAMNSTIKHGIRWYIDKTITTDPIFFTSGGRLELQLEVSKKSQVF